MRNGACSKRERVFVDIRIDDLSNWKVIELIKEHLRDMFLDSPPESVHALDVEALRQPEITLYSAWEDDDLLGCGAIKELDSQHGEIKSMRTASMHLRKGVARRILTHIVDEAKRRGYQRLSLETGSMDSFMPARRLYASFGFEECPPFAHYVLDPNSVFMTKQL